MSRFVATLATLFALLTPHETQALFHLAVIDEVKSGANGNPSIQYVEIRMLSANQTLVAHSRLTVFKCSGDGGGSAVLIADLPANVPNGGPNLRWIMASPSAAVFLAQSGRSEEHTSELQSRFDLVCRLLLEKKKKHNTLYTFNSNVFICLTNSLIHVTSDVMR